MSLLFRGTVKFQIPGKWYPKAWLPYGETIYLIEENEENFLTIRELNSETLNWSRFALIKNGEHVYEFGETYQNFSAGLISNEFILVYTIRMHVIMPSTKLFKISIDTGEIKEWRINGNLLEDNVAVIVNQCLYTFQRFESVARLECLILDLGTDDLRWTPPTRVEATFDTGAANDIRLASLTYGSDIYWLCEHLFREEIGHTRPHPIEKFKLYKFSTSTRQITKVSEELDAAFMLSYHQVFNASFVIGDELCFVFSEHERDFSWMITYNVLSKQWKKMYIPLVGIASVCCVGSQLFTFEIAEPHNMEEEEKRVGIIALSPSLQELCEAVIVKHHVDTSELPKIVQERLQRYTNILGLDL